MRQVQPGTPRPLVSVLSIHIEDAYVHTIPTGKYGAEDWPGDVLVLCNTGEGLEGLTVLPEVVTVTSLQEITLQVLCLNPLSSSLKERLLHKLIYYWT